MFLSPAMLMTLGNGQLEFLYKAAHIRLHRSEAGTLERVRALAEIENIIRVINLKQARKLRLVANNG